MATAGFSLVSSEPPPLKIDQDGTVRVGGTRVTLDTVISAYKQHASADEIAAAFPVLDLADVHATIAYYLKHREAVEAYLSEGELKAGDMRQKIESQSDLSASRTHRGEKAVKE